MKNQPPDTRPEPSAPRLLAASGGLSKGSRLGAFLAAMVLASGALHASSPQEAPPQAPAAPQSPPPQPPADGDPPKTVKLTGGYPDDPRIDQVVRRLLAAGDFRNAEIVATTVAKQHPEMARAKFFLALAVHKQKRYSQAKPLLEAAMTSDQPFPEREHVSHFLGWCRYYLGDLAGAREAFEIHRSYWPNFDDTHFALGVIALDEDRLDDAEESLSQALRIQLAQPENRRATAKTLARLGDVAMRQEKLAQAEKYYRRATELWPDHYEAWARLSRVLARQGQDAESLKALEEYRKAMIRMGRAADDDAPAAPESPAAPQPPAATPAPPAPAPTKTP